MARGKHAKIRKMKEKYADQDEDEREMRMALMGSKQVKGFDIAKHSEHKHGSLVASKKNNQQEDQAVEEEDLVEEVAVNEGATEEPDVGETAPTEVAETQADSNAASRDAEEEVKADPTGEAEEEKKGGNDEEDEDDEAEVAKLIKEEDINMVPESTDVSEIDKLTGVPKQGGKWLNSPPWPNSCVLVRRLIALCDPHVGAVHDHQRE